MNARPEPGGLGSVRFRGGLFVALALHVGLMLRIMDAAVPNAVAESLDGLAARFRPPIAIAELGANLFGVCCPALKCSYDCHVVCSWVARRVVQRMSELYMVTSNKSRE
jgi:hypothetical protein